MTWAECRCCCYDNIDAVDRFEVDVVSVRLGRPVSRKELFLLQSDVTDAAKRAVAAASATAQWKFLCIEGFIFVINPSVNQTFKG